MGKDFGEPIRYDPDFNGPIHNRSCTDILFLILFILFLGVYGFVGYYSITNGDTNALLAPMDSKGRRCGLDSGLRDKPYLVFFDITQCLKPDTPIVGCKTPQVCVNKCPDKTIFFTKENFIYSRESMICKNDIQVNSLTWEKAEQHMNDSKCTKYVIESAPVLNRCLGDVLCDVATATCKRHPKESETLRNQATVFVNYVGSIAASWVTYFSKNANERETYILSVQIVQDLVRSRWYMLGALGGIFIVCFIYVLLLRWVVAPVIWTSIVALICLLGASIYFSYKNYVYYKANPVVDFAITNFVGQFKLFFSKHQTWMGILIVVAIITLILLLMVIFLRARIVIATALIQEGSKAVYAVKSTIFFPIFPWILQCLTIGYGVMVMLYLMSIGEPAFITGHFTEDTNCTCTGINNYTQNNEPCDPVAFYTSCKQPNGMECQLATCHFSGIDNPQSVMWLHLLNLLGLFWTMFFISGLADMMLASTFSTWYWTFKKRNLPFFTLTSGIYRTVRYHMGTVAFGALIIAIVRVIRVILEYIDHKLKKFDNPLTRCVLCFCRCCFWCLESFLKFINKNAYIMCAVHGKAFCASARDAFSLLLRNIVRVVVLDKVTDFIFFLSKLLISVGVGFAVYYLLEWNVWYEVGKVQKLNYNYVPAVILSVATYLISTIFFNVYAMAVDTLFLCFLEDCERNDGSPEKPYFMSRNLMKILGKKNKIE